MGEIHRRPAALIARATPMRKVVWDFCAARTLDREPGRRPGHRLHHQRLPEVHRPPHHRWRGLCQGRGQAAGEGRRGLGHRRLPRRAPRPAHLVRIDGGNRRCRRADALDRPWAFRPRSRRWRRPPDPAAGDPAPAPDLFPQAGPGSRPTPQGPTMAPLAFSFPTNFPKPPSRSSATAGSRWITCRNSARTRKAGRDHRPV
jgi:hypothetical protein